MLGRWALLVGIIVCLAAGRTALAQAVSTPEPACGPTMAFGYYGINLTANVSARAGDNQAPLQNESLCSLPLATASGGKSAKAADQYTNIGTSYAYDVTDHGVDVSAELVGLVNNAKLGSGMGSANVIATWRDTVMVTSASMRKVAPVAAAYVTATEADAITLTVQLKADSVTCAGNTESLYYTTSFLASAVTLVGSTPLGGIGHMVGEYNDASYPRENVCNLGLTSGTVVALNGYPIFVNLGAQVQAGGGVAAGPNGSGDVKVTISGLRLCFVRPPPPSDVEIRSASGNNYWC